MRLEKDLENFDDTNNESFMSFEYSNNQSCRKGYEDLGESYIGSCNCRRGICSYKKIAETDLSLGFDQPSEKTVFYSCNNCNRITYQIISVTGYYPDEPVREYTPAISLNQNLTREEVIEMAKEKRGRIYDFEIKEQIEKRKSKK